MFQRKIQQIKFTQEGLENSKAEYQKLQEERPAAVKELTRAREMGDLSENGLYHAAKANLRSIDGRLRRLDSMIKLADVVKSPAVTVEENGKEIEYKIVGDFEADPSNFKISSNSPIGRVLKDKKVGDLAEIFTPGGKRILKIIKVV